MCMLLSSSALAALIALSASAPADAAGEILITQAKALAGNVTPGDTPGFPVTLSLPGRYQFGSNVLPTANMAGIHVAHRNISIDLNGFELHGAGLAAHGIVGVQEGATIENGTITSFKYDGVNGSGTYFWIVKNMRVVRNGRHGLALGTSSHVEGSVVSLNAGVGIIAETALGNTITGNGSYGILASGGGYGNNTLSLNNGSGNPVLNSSPMHPNACFPGPCP